MLRSEHKSTIIVRRFFVWSKTGVYRCSRPATSELVTCTVQASRYNCTKDFSDKCVCQVNEFQKGAKIFYFNKGHLFCPKPSVPMFQN